MEQHAGAPELGALAPVERSAINTRCTGFQGNARCLRGMSGSRRDGLPCSLLALCPALAEHGSRGVRGAAAPLHHMAGTDAVSSAQFWPPQHERDKGLLGRTTSMIRDPERLLCGETLGAGACLIWRRLRGDLINT